MRRSDKVFRIELSIHGERFTSPYERLSALTVARPSVSSESHVVLKLINLRKIDLNSNEVHYLLLRSSISLDVTLGGAECLMAGKNLHVPE